ncbi:hypothetical protein [Marimonas lutisalis]|uniref:hypothetical protein n=1 Tax=Marimonas lutisalis TaxID=2545756 RepID=UPI0010F7558F|nr:hypothetical protein [Marimonas lutisalis]
MSATIPQVFRDTGLYPRRVDRTPLKQFQVLGERACATNLVRKVIDKNAQIMRTEALGWKHATPHMVAIPRDFLIVCVVRNAENWALSMHKRPWHADPALQRLTFSEFLRAPWRGIVDRPADFEEIHPEIAGRVEGLEMEFDRHPITGRAFQNLFELRRVKQAALVGMLNRDCNMLLVQAERVQADPEGFSAWFNDTFDLKLQGERIKGVKRRLGNRFNLSVDERGETPERLNNDDRAFMLSQLDLDLESALGYDYSPG